MLKIVSIVIMSILITGCWVTERGEKVGTIVKLNKQGLFIKTNEAELVRGGLTNGSGAFGVAPFDFTVENDELLPIVKKSLEAQKQVRIKYHKELFTLFRTETSDNSFLDSIEIIE